MCAYRLGVGIAEVTDPAVGLPLQGMADKGQISAGVDTPLYARAFVVADPDASSRVAIVIADIWAATRKLKDEVLKQLTGIDSDLYTDANLMLAGTHTHSAPGGFSGMLMYDFDFERGGCDAATVSCIATGCVRALEMAHADLAPGRIYINRGDVVDCGRNRSPDAYLCNPQVERDHWGADTDRAMVLLKFVHNADSGDERPIGCLNWYPIHPTDLGQKNVQVSGDNKGYASALFEQRMSLTPARRFVAAFANANCGDVSGSVELGHIPDGVHDRAQMEKHGRQQFDVAAQLFDAATDELTGPVDHRHTRVDFSNFATGTGGERTWPAALGISFAAGSSEDSVPVPDLGVREGITASNVNVGDVVITAASGLGLSVIFGVSVIDQAAALDVREGHLPKPVVFMPGIETPALVPQVLPLQLIRLGTLAILGIPGELSTMAGRRLRASVLGALTSSGIEHVALGAYANDYSQYITTAEEYGSQQYEGASTLFGPHTLEAYQEVATGLATALADGVASAPGPPPTPYTSPPQRRYRIRNLSTAAITLRFYNTGDSLELFTLPNGTQTIGAHQEIAYPERGFTGPLLPTIEQLKVRVSDDLAMTMSAAQLLTVAIDGTVAVGDYSPPPR